MSEFAGIRKILVPLDFSEAAGPLLDYAMELMRARGAVLRLYHVTELDLLAPPFVILQAASLSPAHREEVRAAAEKRLKEIAGKRKGLKFETAVGTGNPAREIAREAKEWGADVIVLGTHGRSGLSHAFLGSVAESVVRLAPCPVLTVRRKDFVIQPV